MTMLRKVTALTLCAATLTSISAFASDSKLPVRKTLENKGYEVSWIQDTKTVVIRDGGFVVNEAVGDTITLDYDTTYASEEFFSDIDEMRKAYEEFSTMATVTEIGEGYFLADTDKYGEVMFRFDTDTRFRHEINRRRYMADDLQVGSYIKIYLDSVMTASLPPQTYAIEVVFSEELENTTEAFVTEGVVTEVGENYFLVKDENGNEMQFNVNDETIFHHTINKRIYKFDDIEVHAEVSVTHTEAVTLSLPPQTTAIEVVLK